MTQPEALRLADALDAHQFDEPHAAAAELRRLHIDNEACGIHLSERMIDLAKVEAQRDALLEALKALLLVLDKAWDFDGDVFGRLHNDAVDADAKARAAIKAAKEKT